jgi:hypothetical protein
MVEIGVWLMSARSPSVRIRYLGFRNTWVRLNKYYYVTGVIFRITPKLRCDIRNLTPKVMLTKLLICIRCDILNYTEV